MGQITGISLKTLKNFNDFSLQPLIWKRFDIVMGMNIKSVHDCDAVRLGTEKGPHYVTRRYAELSAAMVGLSESFPSDHVNGLLAQLKDEVCRCFPRFSYYCFKF